MKNLLRLSLLVVTFGVFAVANTVVHAQEQNAEDAQEKTPEAQDTAEEEKSADAATKDDFLDTGEPLKQDEISDADIASEKKPAAGVQNDELTTETAREIFSNYPSTNDAVGGVVPVDPGLEYYDIYARRLAYKENTKAYRQSIDDRREKFLSYSKSAREEYSANVEKINAADQDLMEKKNKMVKPEVLAPKKDEKTDEAAKTPVSDEKSESEIDEESSKKTADEPEDSSSSSEENENVGVKEEEIPPTPENEGVIKKKVVTSEDAPDFDPSNLD